MSWTGKSRCDPGEGKREAGGERRQREEQAQEGERQCTFAGTVGHLLLTEAPCQGQAVHCGSLRQDAGTPRRGLMLAEAAGLTEALQSSGRLLRFLSALIPQSNQIGLFISQK